MIDVRLCRGRGKLFIKVFLSPCTPSPFKKHEKHGKQGIILSISCSVGGNILGDPKTKEIYYVKYKGRTQKNRKMEYFS